jgi:hypothetical protein
MALSKENLYDPTDLEKSHYFAALSYPARLKILRQLEAESVMCVKQIAKDHPISKETLSDHLRILREAGLVDWVEKFPFTFYWINKTNLARAKKCCREFFEAFEYFDEIGE